MRELKLRVPGPFGEIPLRLAHHLPAHHLPAHHLPAHHLPAHHGERFRGTVLLYHGLRSGKDDNAEELRGLARRGFLAVGVDAIAHGDRRAADFDRQMDGGFGVMLRWIEESAREVPAVIDALSDLIGPRMGKVGLTGISMGGYVAYAAALREPRAAAIVPVLGSPDWTAGGTRSTAFDASSPHLQPEAFANRPLLALNAGRDESVLPHFSRDFIARLRPLYTSAPHALEYVEYPESGHFMSERDWKDVWARAAAFFEQHLA